MDFCSAPASLPSARCHPESDEGSRPEVLDGPLPLNTLIEKTNIRARFLSRVCGIGMTILRMDGPAVFGGRGPRLCDGGYEANYL